MLKSLNHPFCDSYEYMQRNGLGQKWEGQLQEVPVSGSSSFLWGSSQFDEFEALDLKDLVFHSYFSIEREERKEEAKLTRWFLFIDKNFNESWDEFEDLVSIFHDFSCLGSAIYLIIVFLNCDNYLLVLENNNM